MRCVEGVECGKCVESFNFPFSILVMSMLSVEGEACVMWRLTNDLWFRCVLVEGVFYGIVTHACIKIKEINDVNFKLPKILFDVAMKM